MATRCAPLPTVEPLAAGAYTESRKVLEKFVNDRFSEMDDLGRYIGDNDVQVMESNHSHHVLFMSSVIKLGLSELLENTIPWVYRAYKAHGFSYDYFPQELKFWKDSVKATLPPDQAEEICRVYDWMLTYHDVWIQRAERVESQTPPIEPGLIESQRAFTKLLLAGDFEASLRLTRRLLEDVSLSKFFLMVVQPSMYDIGVLWEEGQISVAQEHLATSIMCRVMPETFKYTMPEGPKDLKAVITASPNEFHELGAWMVSDLLEADGWEVRYLGANTPQDELIAFLSEEEPDLLAVSITMPFQIDQLAVLIAKLRESSLNTKVIVGGQVFRMSPEMWRQIGADGYGANAEEALVVANQLCGGRA